MNKYDHKNQTPLAILHSILLKHKCMREIFLA